MLRLCLAAALAGRAPVTAPATIPTPSGACASVSDCYGLGDCVAGRCECDAWSSAAPDCSVFAVEPVDFDPSPGYRNASQQSWGGAFIPDPHGGPGHGFLAAKSPAHLWEPHATDYRAPMVVHVRSRSRASPMDGPFELTGGALNGSFQSQMRRVPASHGGGYVLFSSSTFDCSTGKVAAAGLFAGHIAELDRFGEPDGEGGAYPKMQSVYTPPVVDPDHPWICHTNDWGAEILPDGSVLALFRNGGQHCTNGSYPGWPAEQLGLLRASCWNCTDYKVITPQPLFQGLPNGKSNEDAFLWWSHRGIHMVVHSQNANDPVHAPHGVRGAVAFSPDTTSYKPESWVVSNLPAYGNSIVLKNGSTLIAKRRQRPQLSFAEGPIEPGADGSWPKRTVTHLGNSVDLIYGNNSDGWGAGWALLLPLRQSPASKSDDTSLGTPCNFKDQCLDQKPAGLAGTAPRRWGDQDTISGVSPRHPPWQWPTVEPR